MNVFSPSDLLLKEFTLLFKLRSRSSNLWAIKRLKQFHLTEPSDISLITPETQSEYLRKWVVPLSDIPYEEQLDKKQQWLSYVFSEYNQLFISRCESLGRRASPIRPKLETIQPSPVTEHYRNKDSFIVGPGIDGNPKTVGHFIRSSTDGKAVCIPPLDLISPLKHIEIAKAFQDYIRLSPLPACLDFKIEGYWKGIMVRSNSKGEIMAMVDFHPRNLTEDQLEKEQNKVTDFFIHGPGSKCGLTSLYFQPCPHTRCTAKLAPPRLLHGQTHLIESLLGCLFSLSPTSFFQTNMGMAKVLYENVISAARLKPFTTLLDLCCGTGVVSIVASSLVRGTVGIDWNQEAVEDAKYNAELNSIKTSTFLSGKVEFRLPRVLENSELSSDLVAVLNPGRGGVYGTAIEALRTIPQIRTVIYVSCEPAHHYVIENVIKMTIPEGKKRIGQHFRLEKVIPVDMFPHTSHCEVIMCFHR